MIGPTIEQTEAGIATRLELEAQFSADPHRPCYRFVPRAGRMNDINGSIYWRGRSPNGILGHAPDGYLW